MNTVTYDITDAGTILNALFPYFLVYDIPTVDVGGVTDDTITVTIDKHDTAYDITITITVVDVTHNATGSTVLSIPNCKAGSVTTHLSKHANIVVDTGVLETLKNIPTFTASFNPCCFMFLSNDSNNTTVDVSIDAPASYTLTNSELYITADESVLNIYDRAPIGVRSINGMLPVNGNIMINSKHPVYVDVHNEV